MIEKHNMFSSQQMRIYQNKFIEIAFIFLLSQIHIVWEKKIMLQYYYYLTCLTCHMTSLSSINSVTTKHEIFEQSTDSTNLQIIRCSFRKLLHYTELLCLCHRCLSVCTDCTAMNYKLSCQELKYIIAGKVLVLIVFFFLL